MALGWGCMCHEWGKPSCCAHSCPRCLAQCTPNPQSGWMDPHQSSCGASAGPHPHCPPLRCWGYPRHEGCGGIRWSPRQQGPADKSRLSKLIECCYIVLVFSLSDIPRLLCFHCLQCTCWSQQLESRCCSDCTDCCWSALHPYAW